MIDQIISSPHFKALETHATKLLAKVEYSFAADRKSYTLYLAYLISSNPPYSVIANTDRGLHKFLSHPHYYWLDNKLEKSDFECVELKRDLIKLVLLLQLKQYIDKYRNYLKTVNQLEVFISDHLKKLSCRLNPAYIDGTINEIYSHNLDFLEIGYRNYQAEMVMVNYVPYGIAAMSGLAGAVSTLMISGFTQLG